MNVIVLAVLSATCAALSTTFKHGAAQREARRSVEPVGTIALMLAMFTNPMWLTGLLFDAGAIGFQVLALRFGHLAVVQPLLTSSLAISLLLTHVLHRTRPSRRELFHVAVLVVGLVLFLVYSHISGPEGEEAIGLRTSAIVMAGFGTAFILGCWLAARRYLRYAAQLYGLAVAALYVTTAALIKTCTRIATERGYLEVLLSWQLWVLIAAGALAMVLTQMAFAAGPLTSSLPVIASFDPLFALLVGVTVYGEALSTQPGALLGSTVGLALLIWGVSKLSMAAPDTDPHTGHDTDPDTDPGTEADHSVPAP